ncbi:MAG: hypothetical protein WCI67_03735 [Chloroflexales bacterium]
MQLAPADQSRYGRICAAVHATVATYPSALRQLCAPALGPLLSGEFSQLSALLPAWLCDIIPLGDDQLDALGAAGLWLWWYASALDGLIDADLPAAAMPGAQQALLRALAIYGGLGLSGTPAWDDLQARALLAADAYAREIATREAAPADLSDQQLALWGTDLLVDRAAPFAFALTAQLQLAGAGADDPRRADLALALRALTAARQIADDAADWLADLQRGQLNSASAGLIRHYRAERAGQAGTLSVAQLAGYEIYAEGYWAQVEQAYASLCRQALDRLGPYGDCRLRGLILHQQRSDSAGWARLCERRARVRKLFDE